MSLITKLSIIFALILPLSGEETLTLLEKRKGHVTKLLRSDNEDQKPPEPPGEIFQLVEFPSEVGKLGAYLSKPPEGAGKDTKGPAIIWLIGGFPVSSPGETPWSDRKASNDQSARIYRQKGITMMFPYLRGRGGNPGNVEGFFGEVNDVISALDFLARQKHVDPKRIYLGGHSTGGTLAMLVAASTDRFAGVISFGPTDDNYGKKYAPFDWTPKERELRQPIKHLASIKTPTYVIEGTQDSYPELTELRKAHWDAKKLNPNLKFIGVGRANHFNVLHPANVLLADAIMDSKDGKLAIDGRTMAGSYIEYRKKFDEAADLETLADVRRKGVDLNKPQKIDFWIVDRKEPILFQLKADGFTIGKAVKKKADDGSSYYVQKVSKTILLSDLEQLFKARSSVQSIADWDDPCFDGWEVAPPEKKKE